MVLLFWFKCEAHVKPNMLVTATFTLFKDDLQGTQIPTLRLLFKTQIQFRFLIYK